MPLISIGFDTATKSLIRELINALNGSDRDEKLDELKTLIHNLENSMSLKFDKIEAGLAALATGQEGVSQGIEEVKGEFDELKALIGDNEAAQEKLDSIGESLSTLGANSEAQAKALRDISPNTPAPPEEPPVEEPTA